jgi:hypothetical protein
VDETKLTIYHPKPKEIGVNASNLSAASYPACKEEEKDAELALRIVCEDPTEKDHLADTIARARRRLKKALGELVRATFALLFAYLARLLLGRSHKKITKERGEIGRAERGVLALQRLLGRFCIRRILGRGRMLRALGSAQRSDDEGNRLQSLKLAERRYRSGDEFAGGGVETDSPIVRVVLGVRIAGRGEPVWCIKRFVANGRGGWTPIYSGCEQEAESLLLDFYSEPSLPQQPAPLAEPDIVASEPPEKITDEPSGRIARAA